MDELGELLVGLGLPEDEVESITRWNRVRLNTLIIPIWGKG